MSTREHLQKIPVREYLDSTVVPVVLQAMAAVARERPDDPVDYVAKYLLQHNPRRQQVLGSTHPGVTSIS